VCGSGIVLAEPGKGSAADTLNTVYRDYLFGSAIPEPVHASSTQSLPTMPESGYHSELSEEDRRFAANIRRALEGDGFQLVYQPIVSLKGDSQENYNVFVRLRDDDKRLREAKEFLAAAVRSGRMVAIDRWVIRHAIEELAQQRAQERKLNFFVNIAEESLQEDKLLIWICDYLREYRARGSWLTFQILEDHARRHAAAFVKLSEGLKKVKCRVALNRFGLGPSPEVLLKNLRADFVKFAPELAGGLADDEAKQRRLLALTEAARDNGMRSVFTGVEDARTLTVLWTAGIDYVQGNFLQRPQSTIEPL
jgi:EAL domain-containing protein (putative c-di-GMP-specific phosphodiesterase class I)